MPQVPSGLIDEHQNGQADSEITPEPFIEPRPQQIQEKIAQHDDRDTHEMRKAKQVKGFPGVILCKEPIHFFLDSSGRTTSSRVKHWVHADRTQPIGA
jgi:hypothetical protein